MYIVVGLGNPGKRYATTRHNAGALVVDVLARRHGIRLWRFKFKSRVGYGRIAGAEVWLVKPRTFMNLSGEAVAAAFAAARTPLSRLLVISDDINLRLGALRLRPRGSPGGHKGLASVAEALGSTEFPRLRVGVGGPREDEDVVTFVLSPFPPEEKEIITATLAKAADAVECWLRDGIDRAMSLFNS